jgi:PAS domain S-box-containing protein
MEGAIDILIVEDSQADFLLVSRQLKARWREARVVCVDNRQTFARSVEGGGWDVVLFDFSVPGFDFQESFCYLRQRMPQLPVILVSGCVGEEQAVELLKLGVSDFVLKDNLTRLVPSIERTLNESAQRRARLAAEEGRRESEGRFKSLFENSPIAIGLGDVDSGRMIEVNDAWLRLFGYRREEVIERSTAELGLYVEEEKRARLIEIIAQHGCVVNEAVQLRRKSGEILDILYSAEKVTLGARTCLQVMMTDVTQQKVSVAAITSSEKRYHSLFDNMLEGYASCRMILDAQGRPEDLVYLEVNKSFGELTGLHDVVGRKISEVIPGIRESNRELLETYGRVAATGEPERFETFVPTLGIWFSISVYSVERGTFIAVFDNITASKNAQAARDATISLLHICNEAKDVRELMSRAANFFRKLTSCEAVGIRLRQGDEFPFYEISGLPAHFLRMDNSLCAFGSQTEALPGLSVLDCRCGSVLRGSLDTATPTYTSRGSFWNSATGKLPAGGADCQANLRGRCGDQGYESVAIVPLRYSGETYGLFQFIDKRPGLFNDEKISQYENMVDYISIAFSKLRSDQALLESDQFNQQIIAGAREGIIVYGPDLRYQVWNPYMEQLTGLPACEVLGRHPLELFPFLEEVGVFGMLERALSSGISCCLEFQYRLPQNDSIGWVAETSTPLRNARGEIIGVISTVRDVKEQKSAEEALLLLTKRLQLATASGHLGIWDWDIQNNSLDWDERMMEIYGIKHDTFPGVYIAWENRLHPEDRTMALEAIRLALNGSREYDFEFRIVLPGGVVKHIKTNAVILRDQNGAATRMIGLNQDITERKHLEEQLMQAQKMEAIGLLAGGIAHDFNNMLTAIIGYGNLMLMDMDEGDPQRSNVDEILAAADRAADLTRSLLAFSRKQIINLQPANLNEIITKTGKLLRRIIGEDIELDIDFCQHRLPVNVDAGQIEQVLMNLATNARDAMPVGGVLSIDTRPQSMDADFIAAHGFGTAGDYARVSISDTGTGMDENVRKRLFEPFFTTKEVGKGTGLGLAIVYGIVTQHNGFITVSGNPQGGTTFDLYLPMIKEAEAQKTAAGKKAAAGELPEAGTETILVADDEAALRELTKKVLQQFGYTVITAVDGHDVVNKFREFRDTISLVLLDIIMPKMNGKEAMEEIRKISPESKIILISGYSADIVSQRALLDEGFEFVTKPVSPVKLLSKVREVLDR